MSRELVFSRARRSRSSGRPFCLPRPIAVWLWVLSEVVATIMRCSVLIELESTDDDDKKSADRSIAGSSLKSPIFHNELNCPTFFEKIPRRQGMEIRRWHESIHDELLLKRETRFNLAVNKINTRTRSSRTHSRESSLHVARDFYRSTNCSFKADCWRRLF